MQKTLQDWVIVGVLAAAVGGTASYAIRGSGVGAALLGSATGAVIGAAISTKRQEVEQKRLLEAKETKQKRLLEAKETEQKRLLEAKETEQKQLLDEKEKLKGEKQGIEHELQQLKARAAEQEEKAAEKMRLLEAKAAEQNQLLDEKEKLKGEKQGIEHELQRLKERAVEEKQWKELTAKLPILRAEVEALQTHQRNLAGVEGQLAQKQAELQGVENRLIKIKEKEQELENRVSVINQQTPNLSTLEQLQLQIEQSRVAKSGLSGDIAALQSKVEQLELQRKSLINVSAQLASKQAELERVTDSITKAVSREQELAQAARAQTIELTQLQSQIQETQVTISGLSSQITALNAQVEQLESQRQSLINVSAQLASNQAELAQVNQKIVEARRQEEVLARQAAEQQSTLEQQKADLKFTHRTNERLLSQQQSIEERVNWLIPEKNRLEVEREGILQEIANYRNRVESLEEQRQELIRIEAELTTNQVELNSLNAKIAEAVSRKQELAQAVASQTGELTQLQSQIQEAQVTRSGLSSQITALNAEVETLEEVRRSLLSVEAELTTRQAELNAVNDRIAEARSQEEALSEQTASQAEVLAELQNQIQHGRVESRGLEGQITALRSERERLESQQESLRERLESQQESLTTVSAQLATNQAELAQVNERIAEARRQEEVLARKAAEQQSTLEQQKADLAFTLRTNENLLSQQQSIEERVNWLTPERNRLEVEREGILQKIANYTNQVERLEEQRQELLRIEADLTTRQAELNAVNAQKEAAINSKLELENQLGQIQSQIQELSAQQSSLSGNITVLNTELEFLRATHDSLSSQQQSLEKQVNQLKPDKDRLEAEKQRILQAIQENQQEYQKIEELRHQLNIMIGDRKQLERNIQQLQGSNDSLAENNARLRQEQENIENEIRRLRGEIDALEISSEVALRALREPLWQELPNPRRTIGNTRTDEQQFLRNFISYIQAQGLTFPERVIRAFHTSLKVQDISALVVLAGISGTGKSELPQRYANYIGAQLLTLAVQPRWDSPQDLQGFYNYVEKKFKPTDLMRGLYQYNDKLKKDDRIVIVLLDEMNLARVEYYFSEFISKLETRRTHPTYLEIDVGSLPIQDHERRLPIPEQFLFVGTMNEDETSQSLSDKVLDRANVITFGKPQQLQLRQKSDAQNGSANPSGYLAYSDFKKWTTKAEHKPSLVESIKQHLDAANEVMEKMGHPFAHRVYQAIAQYVVNYPGVEDENSEAFKWAIADQFGQKLLPKLRGVMVDEAKKELDVLEGIIANIGDEPLLKAFQQARAGRYGQFQWQGLIYNEASPV